MSGKRGTVMSEFPLSLGFCTLCCCFYIGRAYVPANQRYDVSPDTVKVDYYYGNIEASDHSSGGWDLPLHF